MQHASYGSVLIRRVRMRELQLPSFPATRASLGQALLARRPVFLCWNNLSLLKALSSPPLPLPLTTLFSLYRFSASSSATMAIPDFSDISIKPSAGAPFVATPASLPIPAFSDISKAANDVREKLVPGGSNGILTLCPSSSTRTSTTPRPACRAPMPRSLRN